MGRVTRLGLLRTPSPKTPPKTFVKSLKKLPFKISLIEPWFIKLLVMCIFQVLKNILKFIEFAQHKTAYKDDEISHKWDNNPKNKNKNEREGEGDAYNWQELVETNRRTLCMEFLHLVVASVPICMLHNLGIAFLAIEAPLCSPLSLSSLCMFLGFFSPPPLLKHHQQSTLDLLHPSSFRRDHFLCIKNIHELLYLSFFLCGVQLFKRLLFPSLDWNPLLEKIYCFALKELSNLLPQCIDLNVLSFFFFLKVDVQKHEFHTHASK